MALLLLVWGCSESGGPSDDATVPPRVWDAGRIATPSPPDAGAAIPRTQDGSTAAGNTEAEPGAWFRQASAELYERMAHTRAEHFRDGPNARKSRVLAMFHHRVVESSSRLRRCGGPGVVWPIDLPFDLTVLADGLLSVALAGPCPVRRRLCQCILRQIAPINVADLAAFGPDLEGFRMRTEMSIDPR